MSDSNSMYINFQTRPKINKHKAERVADKGWDISSTYFHAEVLKDQKTPFKQLFCQKSSDGKSKRRNDESLSKILLGRICHSVKRRSVSEIPTNDFLPGDEESIFSSNDNISYKKLKRDLLKKDVANILQIKKVSLQKVSQKPIDDTLLTFQNVFDVQSRTRATTKENGSLNDVFHSESFVMDNKLPVVAPSKYVTLEENGNQENTGNMLSKLILKEDEKRNGFQCNSSEFKGIMKAPFGISNHIKKLVPCEGTSSYGSNWVQSLDWSSEEDSYHCEKKRINKIMGGYAAQALKIQGKELSEKNIYQHKIGTNKLIGSLLMLISSVMYLDEHVLTKCILFSEEENVENELTLSKKSIYFVLFQKQYFCKQQLKLGNTFLLLKPWHCLQVKSLQYPVIFCIHSKCTVNDNLSNENCPLSNKPRDCISVLNKNLMDIPNIKINSNKEDLFYLKWKRSIEIVGRIQRIWKIYLNKTPFDFSSRKNNYWLSVLFQSKQKTFYQLLISSKSEGISTDCSRNIHYEEGRCYVFNKFRIAQRLQFLRYPKLFKYLKNLLETNLESKLSQEFVFQLVIDESSKLFCKEIVATLDFPSYFQSCFKPLSYLQKGCILFERFSCHAKVLCRYKNFLYISDKSLFYPGTIQYVKAILEEKESYRWPSEIIIKEAVIHEGYLVLDQYSQISLLEENHELKTIHLNCMNIPIQINSKVTDIVTISGLIVNINENEACSWLQCNFCMSENLIQNDNNIIYCEDCSLMVENPILHLKMCVTIHMEDQPNILLQTQLSSDTIRKVLNLDGHSVHPQCNVSDVLGKKCGPFICFIRDLEITANERIFHLNEISASEIFISN